MEKIHRKMLEGGHRVYSKDFKRTIIWKRNQNGLYSTEIPKSSCCLMPLFTFQQFPPQLAEAISTQEVQLQQQEADFNDAYQ